MRPPPVFGQMELEVVTPEELDSYLAEGWRHFGPDFFRYSYSQTESGDFQIIQPLRIRLDRFTLTKNQRRVLRANDDTEVSVVPACVDPLRETMFQKHKARFTSNIPETLRTFIASSEPAIKPCRCLSVEVRLGGKLIAVSYLDTGAISASSVYAMFDPEFRDRSLGTFTFLKEIEWAGSQGMTFLYPGYATVQRSHYDYKKTFRPLEFYDWEGNWKPLEPAGASSGPF